MPTGPPLFSNTRTLLRPTPKKIGAFSPRDREMSACKHTIKRLQNKLTENQKQLEHSKKESKLMNRLFVRQEKDLHRFQSQEGELPQILSRHNEEVSCVQDSGLFIPSLWVRLVCVLFRCSLCLVYYIFGDSDLFKLIDHM
jgi:hypothetical protein